MEYVIHFRQDGVPTEIRAGSDYTETKRIARKIAHEIRDFVEIALAMDGILVVVWNSRNAHYAN